MSTASSANRSIEYVLLALIFIGTILEGSALYIDATAPSFYLALDIEIAGLALIFFGLIGDVLYSHTNN